MESRTWWNLGKNWWVFTFTAFDSSKRLYRASNSFPNDMPGAASRKTGIFIFQPERLFGHWVGEPRKKKKAKVGAVFCKKCTCAAVQLPYWTLILLLLLLLFSCFVLKHFIYDVFTVPCEGQVPGVSVYPGIYTGKDQTYPRWIYLNFNLVWKKKKLNVPT